MKKNELVLILFLVLMTTNNIIPKESFLFGFIGVQQVLAVICFLILKTRKNTSTKLYSPGLLLSNKFLWFILFYVIYTAFKNVYFNLFDTNINILISRIINYSFLSYIIYLIFNKTRQNKLISFRAILSSIVFLGTTSIISNYLIPFGYYISIEGDALDRYNGFIGNGDANTLALAMVIGFAVILNKIAVSGWNFYLFIPTLISIVTIGLSGSRSGFLLLIITIIIFLTQMKGKKIVNGFFLFLVLTLFSIPIFETNINRLENAGSEQTNVSVTSNRVGKWILYTNYFINNPKSLFFGADKEIEVGWNGSFLVAHNIYLQIIYNAGIIFLIYYLYLIRKFIKKRQYYRGNILMMLIPLVLGTFFISDYGSLFFYLFSIIPFIKQNAYVENKVTKRILSKSYTIK